MSSDLYYKPKTTGRFFAQLFSAQNQGTFYTNQTTQKLNCTISSPQVELLKIYLPMTVWKVSTDIQKLGEFILLLQEFTQNFKV